MRLSEHLTVGEFLQTSHRALIEAQERAWATNPAVQRNGQRFALSVFERVRAALGGGPITVTSGYRCPELNVEVGGQPGSHHMLGLAADIIPQDTHIVRAMSILRDSLRELPDLDLGILEWGRWIHVQAALESAKPRHSLLMTWNGSSFYAFDERDPRLRERRLV